MTPRPTVAELERLAPRRLNVGCGEYPFLYWTNLEANPALPAEIHATVPPLPFDDASLDEIYAGHFLEHLTPEDADAFLRECHRVLTPAGTLGVVVPDTRVVLGHYLAQDHTTMEVPKGQWHNLDDLDAVSAVFLYSTVQDSHHLWSYDLDTLKRRMERAGFRCVAEINRWTDPRIMCGHALQCGWDAVKESK